MTLGTRSIAPSPAVHFRESSREQIEYVARGQGSSGGGSHNGAVAGAVAGGTSGAVTGLKIGSLIAGPVGGAIGAAALGGIGAFVGILAGHSQA